MVARSRTLGKKLLPPISRLNCSRRRALEFPLSPFISSSCHEALSTSSTPTPPRTRIKSVICVVSVLPHLEFLVYLQHKRCGENQIFQSLYISISSQGKNAMYGNRIVVFVIVLLLVV